MTLGEQQADRAAHRIPDGDHRGKAERVDEQRRIVGGIGELKAIRAAQPAAMATMVDGDERVVLGEGFVGGEELEIRARRPPVQQQQRRRGGIGVAVMAVEHLAATGQHHRVPGRQPRHRQRGDRRLAHEVTLPARVTSW